MKYNVFLSKASQTDLAEAMDYIEFQLMNPCAADALLDKFEKSVNSLSVMPEKHALASDPFLNSKGVRFIPIDNYILFYTINKSKRTVSVARFLYGKRNWAGILKDEPLSL
ncbi:MAG: type II toxin-antitoxin system RelE/ParE family toxin [Clostridiales bacterium]|nr:type II toxin-antitoxin system RelE/ParE family toxin [Clostridiales bacterium]